MLVHNPIINMDMPDMDIIRVKDTYYMVSTTMFMMPGAPILRSKNLCEWEIVSYIFDVIEENEIYTLKDGKNAYGKGQWATSLRYYNGEYYAAFVCHDMGKTYIYHTDDIEKSNWQRYVIDEVFHDMSIFIYHEVPYLIYGNGEINIVELESNLSAVKQNGKRKLLFSTPKENIGLRCEGCRAYFIDDYVYLLFIEWPQDGNGRRREVCYRARDLFGTYERKIIMDDDCDYLNQGIAQGVIIDSEHGDWYSMLFQDHGAVGRIPYLMPMEWQEGWPVLGIDGKVPKTFVTPFQEKKINKLITSDSFDHPYDILDLRWEWNHNPDPTGWTFQKKKGYLCLSTNEVVQNVLQVRNILTQKTMGPKCSCCVEINSEAMKRGDYAGLIALQGTYGMIGVEVTNDEERVLLLRKKKEEQEWIEEQVQVIGEKFWLRIDFNFQDGCDEANFYYALEKNQWHSIGNALKMKYTLDLFIGYRIGIFYYATREKGGNAYFKDFIYQ